MRFTRFAACILAMLAATGAFAGTYTVTTTADSGAGSLRQGILDANGGTACTSPCTIVFDSTLFATTQTINLTGALPTISASNVTIDGFTGSGSGATGTPNSASFGSADTSVQKVVVNGASTTCCAVFAVSGTGVTIKGLVIQDGTQGISVTASGSVTVTGCKIGTNAAGTAAVPNGTGILVFGTSPTAIIGGTTPAERNLISGNSGAGISVQSANNTILGNYIGTTAAGTAALANGTGITSAGSNNVIGNTVLGNLISGNTGRGVEITNGTAASLQSNRIGTNGLATAALGNGTDGVYIGSGAPAAVGVGGGGFGNVISGNGGDGIEIAAGNGNHTIANNTIGVNLSQTATIGNGEFGIHFNVAGSNHSIITNTIGGNGFGGIGIASATNVLIQSNDIGYKAGLPLPNTGHGIAILGGAIAPFAVTNNVIRSNSGNGVDVDGAVGVQITQNAIADNTSLGIDLHASAISSGATANDAGDGDNGAGNNLQNYPVVTSATTNGGTASSTLTVKFNVDSASVSTTNSIRVETFVADTAVTNPEGLAYVGGNCYAGNTLTNQTLTVPTAGVTPGMKIVTTATSYTDGACTSVNDGTSEFSSATLVALQPGLVTNTNDSGVGSLRQAISDANAATCPSPCTITFNIPTTDAGYDSVNGIFVIKPTSALPTILRDNTFLDATTQTAFTGNTNAGGPEVVLNGALAGASSGLTIGSASAGQGSNITIRGFVINGWSINGIAVAGSTGVTNAAIQSNYIGTNHLGTAAVPNGAHGVQVTNIATGTVIGGTSFGNLISGNIGSGIYLQNSGVTATTISDNAIGSDITKTSAVMNNGHGIWVDNIGGGGLTIGSPANTIAFNGGDGVAVTGTTANVSIRGNNIHSNTQRGIDLADDDVTPNDAGDGDTGPNALQNFPVLTLATFNGTNTTISGTLNSLPLTQFDIDWYSNASPDPLAGEGAIYENTSTFTTDASGNANVSIVLTGNKRGSFITATASRVNGALRETSEFSVAVANNAPVANTDAPSTAEDTPLTFDPRANDTDPENDAITITGNTQPSPAAGSVTCTATSCTFTPTAEYSGVASFTYTIQDALSATATGTVNITVTAVADPPVANTDIITTSEDTPNSVNVLLNDTDVDTPPASLTVSGFTQGAIGSVSCTAAGVCTYTPNANQSGADSFTYTVTDGTTPVTGTVNVSVTAVNDPPVANNDTLVTNEDTANTVNVLTNDTDVDTPPASLGVAGFTQGTKGSVSCTGTGVCTYTPNLNQNGADSFTYNVTDGTSTVTGTVNVTINAINDPPVANADTLAIAEDTPGAVNVLTNDTDVDTAPSGLTVTSSTNGTKGIVTCTTAGVCTYTPNLNQNGGDSFTYTVSDGTSSAIGTVNVTIGGVNDPPVANNDTLTTNEDTPGTVNVLANDVDPDSTPTISAFSNGGNGSVSCAGTSCTYTPNVNFNGTDSFTYTISDGTSSSTATVNVTVTAVNDPPVANPDALATTENVPASVNVLTNDVDPDSALTVSGSTNGTKGTVVCSPSGSCTYTPNTGQSGTDSFTYTVTDGTSSAIGTVTVTITGVNDPPVANNDALSTVEDTPGTVNVLANDVDPDSTPTVVSWTNGSGTVSCTGAGLCTYTPPLNFFGTDTFTYTISDGTSSSTASVLVTVSAVNDAPVANPDSGSTTPATPVTINVLANDTDPENDALMVSANTNGSNGTVTCTASGNCTYSPNGGFSGTDTFTYTLKDAANNTTTGTVTVTVLGCVNEAPTLFTPRNLSTNVPTSGRLSWNNVGATSYAIYLGPLNSRGCDTPFASTSDTSIEYSGLLPNTAYAWKVVALVGGCPDKVSECVTFTTASSCNITPATLLRPLGTTPAASPVEFAWTPVAGATGYKLFINGVEAGTTTTETRFVTTVATDGPASWTVAAIVPNCGEIRSNAVQFNVCNRTGTPLASVVGQATSGQNYRVTWEQIPNASRYEVQQSETPDFANPITTSTERLFEQFRHEVSTEPKAFYYRVRAFNACSQTPGDYSPVIRVVIVPLPPREEENRNANVPVGSTQIVIQQVFVPGEPNQTLFFTATADRPWLTVRPASGLLPPQGITLEVLSDPSNLPNGTFTATVIVTVSDTAAGTGGRNASTNATTVRPIPVSISLVTPVTPVLTKVSPTNDALIIPSIGHLGGINSQWQSDIRVTNLAATSTRYQLTFTPTGGTADGLKQTTITVAAGETTALDDIVRNWYGLGSLSDGASGMLEIKPLDGVSIANTVASSRTYNVTDNGTLGQFIPAIPFGGFIGKAVTGALPQVLGLQQIAQSSAYRTNVGVVEASGNPTSVVLSVFNSAGLNVKDIAVELKGGEQRQLNSLLATHGITLDDGRIEVKVTDGIGKVTAYASVVDNKSLDPLLVSGVPLGTQQANRWIVPGVADLNTGVANWRTDMRVFNSSLASQNATLTLHPIGAAPISTTVTIAPNEVRSFDDIVKSVFKASSVGGAVHVDTANSASLVVSGRTYNLTEAGTFGQFIPAVTVNDAVALGGRQLNVLQVEDSSRYRTNLGLAEVTGKPVTVEVMVHLPDTKSTPVIQVPLAANEFRQLSVIRDMQLGNVYNARITVRVIGGDGRVAAYGSVIDMQTQDPTYVPAQ